MPGVTRDIVTVAEGVVIFVCGMLDGGLRTRLIGLLPRPAG